MDSTRGVPALGGALEDDPLLRRGADGDPGGERFGGGTAEAEHEAGAEPAGIERYGGIEAGEVEVEDALAGQQLGERLAAAQGVEDLVDGSATTSIGWATGSSAFCHGRRSSQRDGGRGDDEQPSGQPQPPHQSICLRMNVGISISGVSAGGPAAGGACGSCCG